MTDVIESRLERADAEADRIWKEAYGEKPEPPSEEEPLKEETSEKEKEVITETPPEEKPPEPVPIPQKETPKPPVEGREEETYKHKYDTLEGKYKAEVTRLHQELNGYRSQLTDQQKKISELETQVAELSRASKAIEADQDLNELEKNFPDIGKAIKKLKSGYESTIAELEKKLGTKLDSEIGTVKTDLNVSKQDLFDNAMTAAGVPNWREIDAAPEFSKWLAQPISQYTTLTKMDVLKHSARNFDAATVAKMMNDYKESLNKSITDSKAEETAKEEELEKFIAPPSSPTGGTPPGTRKQSGLTRAAYTKFMQESSKNKFNPAQWGGKTEEQVEAMFDEAIANKTLI